MIVVGVDFSEGSAAAVALARALGAERTEQVLVVHVRGGSGPPEELDGDRRAWLQALDIAPGAVELRRGVPWVELVRSVEERGAAFLVAGTHGSTGFQPLRLGSTATHIALRSPAPVVLVPPVREEARRSERFQFARNFARKEEK